MTVSEVDTKEDAPPELNNGLSRRLSQPVPGSDPAASWQMSLVVLSACATLAWAARGRQVGGAQCRGRRGPARAPCARSLICAVDRRLLCCVGLVASASRLVPRAWTVQMRDPAGVVCSPVSTSRDTAIIPWLRTGAGQVLAPEQAGHDETSDSPDLRQGWCNRTAPCRRHRVSIAVDSHAHMHPYVRGDVPGRAL